MHTSGFGERLASSTPSGEYPVAQSSFVEGECRERHRVGINAVRVNEYLLDTKTSQVCDPKIEALILCQGAAQSPEAVCYSCYNAILTIAHDLQASYVFRNQGSQLKETSN